jgi:hypothetical protein
MKLGLEKIKKMSSMRARRICSKHRGSHSESDDCHEIEILPGLQVTLRYLLTMDTLSSHYSFYSASSLTPTCSGAAYRGGELDWLRVSDATHVLRGCLDSLAAVPRSYFLYLPC